PNRDKFLALGSHDSGEGPQFNMTALALRSAGEVNAVSQLHGKVTRDMWASMWPGVPEDRRPVSAITNGVHAPTWISAEMAGLVADSIRRPGPGTRTAGARVPRRRPARAATQRGGPTGANHLRWQVASRGRHRQAAPPARVHTRARTAFWWTRRLRR